jgi:hypothetical protein
MQVLGLLRYDQAQLSRQLAHPLGRSGCKFPATVDDLSCSLFCFGNTTNITVARWEKDCHLMTDLFHLEQCR